MYFTAYPLNRFRRNLTSFVVFRYWTSSVSAVHRLKVFFTKNQSLPFFLCFIRYHFLLSQYLKCSNWDESSLYEVRFLLTWVIHLTWVASSDLEWTIAPFSSRLTFVAPGHPLAIAPLSFQMLSRSSGPLSKVTSSALASVVYHRLQFRPYNFCFDSVFAPSLMTAQKCSRSTRRHLHMCLSYTA